MPLLRHVVVLSLTGYREGVGTPQTRRVERLGSCTDDGSS